MRKLNIYYLLVILSYGLITACSVNSTEVKTSSSMIRTVGIGENAMPIEKGSFTLEFFNERATTVDIITETYSYTEDELEITEHDTYGANVSDNLRYFGFNTRIGFDNYTEAKLGVFAGSIEDGHKRVTDYNSDGHDYSSYTTYSTDINGFHVGIKRLLTNYNEPHRVSLYLDGKYLKMYSDDIAKKYDGSSMEAKFAVIYGYLPDPETRTFPSIAIYSSVANTEREQTIDGIPLKKQPQAVGAEANLTLDIFRLYTIFSLGVEKELVDESTDDLNVYFGMKVGLQFNRLKHKKTTFKNFD